MDITLPVVWEGVEELPLLYANMFALSVRQDEVFLVIGAIQPPVLIGAPDDQRSQAQHLSYVPVKPVANLALNPVRLRELYDMLHRHFDGGGNDE